MNSRRVLLSMTVAAVVALLLPAQAVIRALALEPQQPQLNIVISGAGGQPPKLGIPDFVVPEGDADLKAGAKIVSSVLWSDLDFEREFYLIDQARSASIPLADSPETLAVEQWADLGAEYVVIGTARRTGDALVAEVRVVGVTGANARKIVGNFAYKYDNCSLKKARACAHYIADDIHKKLRALDGVAQSILGFNSDRDAEVQNGAYGRVVKEIYIADYDGANPQRVTGNRTLSLSPTLSPDGTTIAYVSYASGFPDIYVRPIYQVGKLTRPAGGTPDNQNKYPALSPDGTMIAYASNRDGGSNNEIYVVDREGKTQPRRLTNNPALDFAPTWSPTGTQIAFISDRTGKPYLYVMSSDGLNVDNLTSVRADHPSWSPAGNLIAFTCGDPGPNYNICVVDVATRKVSTLTDGVGTNEQPIFAPNGRHIVFHTTRWGGKKQLAIIDLTGKYLKRVTETGNNEYPAWARGHK